MFFYGVVISFCVVSQSTTFYFRDTITDLFSDNHEKLRSSFSQMVLLFVWLAPTDILVSCCSVSMQTVGLNDQLVCWNLSLLIVTNAAICVVVQQFGLMSAAAAFIIISSISGSLLIMCIYKTSMLDWEVITLCADESNEEEGGDWVPLIDGPVQNKRVNKAN